jgi:Rrf2 family protein
MRLGRASALGVFASTHVADCEAHAYCRGREIADSLGVPVDYLLKILQKLVKARILESTRGPNGGFRLHAKPDETTLLAIVEAIDGPVAGRLTTRDEIKGRSNAKKRIESACEEAARFARLVLAESTIRDLMDRPPKKIG